MTCHYIYIYILAAAVSTATTINNNNNDDNNFEITGQGETIQTTELLTSARILRRVLDTSGDL